LLDKLAEEVKNWNEKAGNNYEDMLENVHTDSWWNQVLAQAKVNAEEANEILSAAQEKDAVELLDGLIDNFYTACGLLAMLSASGYSVGQGVERVLDNNNKKIFESYHMAASKLEDIDNPDFYIDEAYINGVGYYTIKDQNMKIRKYKDFPKVDLSDLVPVSGLKQKELDV